MIGHRGEAPEHIVEVGQRFDLMATAAFQDGVNHGGAWSGVGVANEQPVLGAEFGRADGLFGQVVVDAGFTKVDIRGQFPPLILSVTDRTRHG